MVFNGSGLKNQSTPVLSQNYHSSHGVENPLPMVIHDHFTQNIGDDQHRS